MLLAYAAMHPKDYWLYTSATIANRLQPPDHTHPRMHMHYYLDEKSNLREPAEDRSKWMCSHQRATHQS